MRIVFAGSPEIALPSLHLLHQHHTICAILTNPDRPSGRGGGVTETPVAAAARALGLPVMKPGRLGAPLRKEVEELGAELLVVVAFGRFFGPRFLALFPRGAVNLHPSLLPKYRGPSPIPAAILAGDTETGISVQKLSQEMDSGDVLAQKRIALTGRETTESLTEICAQHGARLLGDVLERFDSIVPEPQDPNRVSFCRMIKKEDGLIDWSRSAADIDRMVRAYTPWPEAHTIFEGVSLHILEAEPAKSGLAGKGEPSDGPDVPTSSRSTGEEQSPGSVVGVDKKEGILIQTGDGVLVVKKLKLQSKKALGWKDFLNGARGFVGSTLGGAM